MYMLKESKCPYCSNFLSHTPKRKTKCKVCGNYFYVKTRLPDNVQVIVTEEEKANIEKEWAEYRIENSFFSGGIISEEEFQEAKKLYLSKGENISNNDIVWGLFNKRLTSLMEQNGWEAMEQVYCAMAQFLQREGKDCFHLLQEASKCRLRGYKEQGIKEVEILTAGEGNACKECQRLNGNKFTIETALTTMPIPVKECSTEVFVDGKGFCRCLYLPVVD